LPSPARPASRVGKRRGITLTVLVLLAVPVLLAVFFLAVNVAFLAQARATLQNNADADALAAVQSLVDDARLTGLAPLQQNLIGAARSEAQQYAGKNLVLGQPLSLDLPAMFNANPPDGDVVFAFLDEPRSKQLVVADLDSSYNGSPFLSWVNTVRVHARRIGARGTAVSLWGGIFTGLGSADVVTVATATLDQDVVGFQPVGGDPIPLAPIALLARAAPADKGMPSSWENQLQLDVDAWALGPSGQFIARSDGLPEATLILDPDETKASAALLLLGSTVSGPGQQSALAGQIASGVTASDLQGMGGVFALSSVNNRLAVPATRAQASFYSDLAGLLNAIQGQKRIWPLYESFDAQGGQVVISGFVAARLVQASVAGGSLTLVLQPCMLSTRTAITNPAQRGVGGVDIFNPYICKVRLVE
jgi:hypothetical protein